MDWTGGAFLVAAGLFGIALFRGRRWAVAGMALAVGTTLTVHNAASIPVILVLLVLGGGTGLVVARRTGAAGLPRLVPGLAALTGCSGVLAGAAAWLHPAALGITTGRGAGMPWPNLPLLLIGMALALVLFCGASAIMLRGGARQAATLSLLAALSGFTATALGFAFQNVAMVATGGLVGGFAVMLWIRAGGGDAALPRKQGA